MGEWMDQEEEIRLTEEGMDQFEEDMKNASDEEYEKGLPYDDD